MIETCPKDPPFRGVFASCTCMGESGTLTPKVSTLRLTANQHDRDMPQGPCLQGLDYMPSQPSVYSAQPATAQTQGCGAYPSILEEQCPIQRDLLHCIPTSPNCLPRPQRGEQQPGWLRDAALCMLANRPRTNREGLCIHFGSLTQRSQESESAESQPCISGAKQKWLASKSNALGSASE